MRTIPALRRFSVAFLAVFALAQLSACGERSAHAQAQAPGGAPPPMEVPVVTVAPERISVTDELPGRLEATRVAQVRARVPGIVQKRVFREGSEVKAGEVLFRVDAGPYQASLNSAEAALAKAEANLAQANLKVQRFKPLVETNAISKQEFDDAQTAQKQAAADVAAAKAARESARLNLGYATVTAPIAGRIGRALVTEGALVGQGEATPLAVIQQLDPIYVNITQSAAEALQLRRAMANGQLQAMGKGGAKVTIVTEDGQEYPHAGKLLFSDLTVDQSSGAITLRAEVPNPDHFLLPGMYVRARVEQAVNEKAIAVPQQAVQRDVNGAAVFVVGAGDKVELRPVKTDAARNNMWIISEGLQPGDRVIVEGFQKLGPGAPVKPVPWKGAQPATAAAQQ
ncbi:MAG TPA: efflux RND transporter periplasmic adaptor subunit [Noviherbaspirillum sp.]|nr:efflux RND transporter periplasmic adaptor subunit [Noviherbaspirillum sp.]